MKRLSDRKGVSLVELLMGVVVLSFGILGMAAGSAVVVQTVQLSRLDSQRAAALQAAVEEVKATPLTSLSYGRRTDGNFVTAWTIVSSTANSAQIRFILVGPGRNSSGVRSSVSTSVADTLVYTRFR